MLGNSECDRFNRLAEKVRLADNVSTELIGEIISGACPRLALMGPNRKLVTRITDFIKSCAWFDVSLALIEAQLPKWTLRRLSYDNGEWYCSLSKQANLPIEIDDTADAHHEAAALAILSSFLEAQRGADQRHHGYSTVPHVSSSDADYLVCCDNFA